MDNVPAHSKAGLTAMRALQPTKEELRETATNALNMMREGMKLADIADALGLSKGWVSQLVIQYFPEEWKVAKTAANLIRYESAQEEFDNDGSDPDKPQDGTKLAYAREKAKFAHLMLQSTRRDIFDLSNKTEINLSGGAGGMQVQIVSFAQVDGDGLI